MVLKIEWWGLHQKRSSYFNIRCVLMRRPIKTAFTHNNRSIKPLNRPIKTALTHNNTVATLQSIPLKLKVRQSPISFWTRLISGSEYHFVKSNVGNTITLLSNILFSHIHAMKNIIMIVMTIIIDAGDCDHKLSLIPDAAEVPWRKNVINYFSSWHPYNLYL